MLRAPQSWSSLLCQPTHSECPTPAKLQPVAGCTVCHFSVQ